MTVHQQHNINTTAEGDPSSALLIGGSDTETSTLRGTCRLNYVSNIDIYPRTSPRALGMLIGYKDTKQRGPPKPTAGQL